VAKEQASWWVDENDQVVGVASDIGLPANFREVSGVNLPLPNVYFNGSEVIEKPPQPADDAEWDATLKSWVTPPEPLPPPPQPDYLAFRMGMLRDPGYDRITLASNVLRVTRMETAVTQNPPELPIVAAMWGMLIDELSEKPKAAEVKAWNVIAHACNVPIKFGKDGKMVLAS
jgi:hypothetical protein